MSKRLAALRPPHRAADMGSISEKDFFELYDRHYAHVRRFIAAVVKNDESADDLVQETFIRAYKKLATLKDPSKTAAWLMRIGYNLCRDHFRRKKDRKASADLSEVEALPCNATQTERALARREMSDCVQAQMTHLPETQRSVLILYDVIGFSHREIAKILGIRIENVKVRLHRARNGLKAILQQNCTFEHDERSVFICLPK